jgi:hypothetical protein
LGEGVEVSQGIEALAGRFSRSLPLSFKSRKHGDVFVETLGAVADGANARSRRHEGGAESAILPDGDDKWGKTSSDW